MLQDEIDRREFPSLEELRDYLNTWTARELGKIYPQNGDYFVLVLHEETLSDGSQVANATLTER